MPPEQVKGEPADNRSDLYSLGVSLYELVTGQLPFQAESNYAMMAAHLQEDPKPPIVLRPGIPQPLNQIILMAMAKDPGSRFQSADAFRGALKSVQAHSAGTQPAVDQRSYTPTSAATAGGATALFQETPASQSPTTVLDTPAYQRTQPAVAAETPIAPPPPAVRQGGHRGLYIALGAFIVVAVLFVAGLYLPGHLKTLAGAGKHSPSTQQAQPADSATSIPAPSAPPTPADAATPAAPTATPADAPVTTPPTSPSTATGSSPTTAGTQASQSSQSSADAASTPSTPPADSSAAASANASAGGTPTPPAKKPNAAKSRKNSQAATQSRDVVPSGSGSNASQAQSEAAAQAEELEQKYTEVDSRSVAATQALDNLQRQQAAAGYGLRSDIVSAQQRMKADLNKAQYYMQKQDSKNAKKYLDMADAELQTIEKFLGH
jgi:eukaryotic-like serine/threonine-protein kinase